MTSLWLQNPRSITTDPFVAGAEYDEVIVGAGLTGLVTALLFARAGRKVAVLEARTVGAVTTGNTTAKISMLQGTQLTRVRTHTLRPVLQAYADANRAAFDWLIEYTGAHDVPLERRAAYTYAGTEDGGTQVRREFDLARSVGLDAEWTADVPLPFRTFGAVRLDNQAQLDPMDLLAALAADLRILGGVIHEDSRAVGVTASAPAVVRTARGEVRADHVILTTGTPILDRGLYFAKVAAQRSYAQAFEITPGTAPTGMFLGVEKPTRSVRTAGALLLTGGNGHPVGRAASTRAHVDELERWTMQHWPGARRVASWSAQDYSPAHHVPFVGWLPRGKGRIFLATGYDKWGMTNGVAAAITLVDDILGTSTDWQKTLHHRVTTPRAMGHGIGENAAVAWWYARGYAKALTRRLPDAPPPEGAGAVRRDGLRPTAVSTVDGVTCALSAVCSHLGAVVSWNDAERSWDCPAHGSRFSADGTPLEGPATRGLATRSTPLSLGE